MSFKYDKQRLTYPLPEGKGNHTKILSKTPASFIYWPLGPCTYHGSKAHVDSLSFFKQPFKLLPRSHQGADQTECQKNYLPLETYDIFKIITFLPGRRGNRRAEANCRFVQLRINEIHNLHGPYPQCNPISNT